MWMEQALHIYVERRTSLAKGQRQPARHIGKMEQNLFGLTPSMKVFKALQVQLPQPEGCMSLHLLVCSLQ
jgi:hypothetical protein